MAGIPRICPCGHRVAYGDLCPCQRAKKAEADKKRPSARARGYDVQWEKERAAFLKVHPICAMPGCGKPATVVDHKIPHKGNDKLFRDRSNWQPMCASCHSSRKQRQEKAQAKGKRQFKPVTPGGGSKLSTSSTGTGMGPFSRGISQMEHFNRGRK